jgi:hypothetical protein
MKSFDKQWQACAAQARQAPRPGESAPLGFAARVAARVAVRPQRSREAVWEGLALRLVWGAAAMLLVCAAIETPHLRRASLFDCGVEDSMTQVIWSL